MSALARLAATAPAPVFAVSDGRCRAVVEDLGLDGGIELVTTPRHATVLLVAGDVPDDCAAAVARLHDQLPHPRATLRWNPGSAEPVEAVRSLHQRLLRGEHASEDDLLPDEPPHPWRGEGPHGQGGKGMMGGTPYGRPMAMTADDRRDGLALDALTVRVGPFLPPLPPGLTLELTLQGDVVQGVQVCRAPFAEPTATGATGALRHLARFAAARELPLLARRLRGRARAIEGGGPADAGDILRALRRSGLLWSVPPGLGRLDADLAARLGGHAARAAERGDGDVRARVRQWLDDAASAAGGDTTAGEPLPPDSLGRLLTGLEWDEMVAVLTSFDTATLVRLCGGGA